MVARRAIREEPGERRPPHRRHRCVIRARGARTRVGVALVAVSLGLAGWLGPSRAAADEPCVSRLGPPVRDAADVEERLDYLARVFDREIDALDTWSLVWASVSTAAVVGQAIPFAITRDYGSRVDFGVGIGVASFGVATLHLLPLRFSLPLRAARRDWSARDRCAVLARAEDTLRRVEKEQTSASGLLPHVGNIALQGAVFLILGWGYGRWTAGALSGGIGVAVGEVTAFTQPHHLKGALEDYEAGRYGGRSKTSAGWRLGPAKASPESWGAAFELAW